MVRWMPKRGMESRNLRWNWLCRFDHTAALLYTRNMLDIRTKQRIIVYETVDHPEFYIPSIQVERVEMLLSQQNIECIIDRMSDGECLVKISDWTLKVVDIQKILDSVD